MLLQLLYPLHLEYPFLNVFRYISFRTFGASITAVFFCILVGSAFIRFVKRRQVARSVQREGVEANALARHDSPPMGGALILITVVLTTLIWGDLTNKNVWIVLLTGCLFGLVGYWRDYRKLLQIPSKLKKNPKKNALIYQVVIALVASYCLFLLRDAPPVLKFPFFKEWGVDLGVFFIPFSALIIVGAANAVSLTDDLDGFALGPSFTTAMTFLLLSYCAGHLKIAEYLQIPYISGAGELAVLMGGLACACLGFLWFNTYPAQAFMGETGSLSIGAALGTAAVVTKNELVLFICGGVFVVEGLSVIGQAVSYRLSGKKALKVVPLHHQYELKGWAGPKIVVRFWIISVLLALFAVATLKLR